MASPETRTVTTESTQDFKKRFEVFVRMSQAAQSLYSESVRMNQSLQELGRIEAPEGHHLLLEWAEGEPNLLWVEEQDPEYNMSKFQRAITRPDFERLTTELDDGSRVFIGSAFEVDKNGSFWVYDSSDRKRALCDLCTKISLCKDWETGARLRQ